MSKDKDIRYYFKSTPRKKKSEELILTDQLEGIEVDSMKTSKKRGREDEEEILVGTITDKGSRKRLKQMQLGVVQANKWVLEAMETGEEPFNDTSTVMEEEEESTNPSDLMKDIEGNWNIFEAFAGRGYNPGKKIPGELLRTDSGTLVRTLSGNNFRRQKSILSNVVRNPKRLQQKKVSILNFESSSSNNSPKTNFKTYEPNVKSNTLAELPIKLDPITGFGIEAKEHIMKIMYMSVDSTGNSSFQEKVFEKGLPNSTIEEYEPTLLKYNVSDEYRIEAERHIIEGVEQLLRSQKRSPDSIRRTYSSFDY
jgi:hypothetical protein